MDTWLAQLSDGSWWTREAMVATGGDGSTWRRLEAFAADLGLGITQAVAILGGMAVGLTAEGHPIVSGETIITAVEIGQAGQRETRLRWVRREEPGLWLWRATDGLLAWEVVAPPGEPLHRHLAA